MLQFADAYRPLLIDDHLIRLGFEARLNDWGLKNLPRTRVESWKKYAAGFKTPKHFQSVMTDRDLWLVATAAEVLGAASVDSVLVPLGASSSRLREMVATGVAFFQASRTLYQDTKNFTGQRVRSASYFNGDYIDHSQMAFAGYEGSRFPRASDTASAPYASWDVSHAYRLPVFLRSLADTRGRSGTAFPTDEDIRLIINQYAYRAFNRDFEHPYFHNFFDGSDGWFRVNYLGRTGTGYPPSRFCDARSPARPCLSRGAIMGWGLLVPWSGDLERVLRSIVDLADDHDADHTEFRDRYYLQGGEKFMRRSVSGREQHPFLLFGLAAELKRAPKP